MTLPGSPPRKALRAFTFLELLASIGIILALVALLTPILLRARNQARQTQCASNLQQLGLALHLYAQDYGGRFPPEQDNLSQAMPYLKNLDVLTCSMDPDRSAARARLQASNSGKAPLLGSYSFVGGYALDDDPTLLLARDRQPWHEGANVLSLDGHVEWWAENRLREPSAPPRGTR